MADYRVKGALFENKKDVGPAFTGFVEIDGVRTLLALWPKTSAKGDNYLQVSEDKKKANAGPPNAPPAKSPFKPRHQAVTPKPAPDEDMDNDTIPF